MSAEAARYLDIAATIFGGLGLFFIGVKSLSGHMKQLAGRRFRDLVSRMTANRFLSSLLGIVSGALTQSSNAVTFIVVSLVSTGMITIPRALPLVAWSNVGTALLVLLATLDLRLLVLFLLGLIGICHYFDLDRSTRHRHTVGAVLGIALLFLGLVLIKSGAAPLRELPGVAAFIKVAAASPILLLVAGTALSFIAQSSSTVSVVAVTMTKVGLLSVDQTLLIIYGASLGSGLSIWFLASNLRGSFQQISLYQVLLKSFGTALFVLLFWLESSFGFPLVKYWTAQCSPGVATQVALAFLALQCLPALIFTCFNNSIQKLLRYLAPPTREEELSTPVYLYEQAVEEPGLAIDLLEREQGRLLAFLPEYLDAFREEPETQTRASAELHDRAGIALSRVVSHYLTQLADRGATRETTEDLMKLQNFQTHLDSLRDSLREFANATASDDAKGAICPLLARMTEGLHALLAFTADAAQNPAEADPDMLVIMTSDRSDLMERSRRQLMDQEKELSKTEQQLLYSTTTLFERIIWLVRRVVVTQPTFARHLKSAAKSPAPTPLQPA